MKKRILSSLCALFLLFVSLPASASTAEDDFLLHKTAEMLPVMREYATLKAEGNGVPILQAVSGEVKSIHVLRFDHEGLFDIVFQNSEEDIPEISAELTAYLEKGTVSSTITNTLLSYSGLSSAAVSILTVSDFGLAPSGMQRDALVVFDFGTDYQIVSNFTLSGDGAVFWSVCPTPTDADIVQKFRTGLGLTDEDVQVFSGDVLQKASLTEALPAYSLHMAAEISENAVEYAMFSNVSPEVLAYISSWSDMMQAAQPSRIRLLTLNEKTLGIIAEALNIPASMLARTPARLTSMYASMFGERTIAAGAMMGMTTSFAAPRSMPMGAIVQLDYENDEGDLALSLLCTFTLGDGDTISCTATPAPCQENETLIDLLISGEADINIDSACITELK